MVLSLCACLCLQEAEEAAQERSSPALPIRHRGILSQNSGRNIAAALAGACWQSNGLADPFGLANHFVSAFGAPAALAQASSSPPDARSSQDSAASVCLALSCLNAAPDVPDCPDAIHRAASPDPPAPALALAPAPASSQLVQVPSAATSRHSAPAEGQAPPGGAAVPADHMASTAPAGSPATAAAQGTAVATAQQPLQDAMACQVEERPAAAVAGVTEQPANSAATRIAAADDAVDAGVAVDPVKMLASAPAVVIAPPAAVAAVSTAPPAATAWLPEDLPGPACCSIAEAARMVGHIVESMTVASPPKVS